MMLNELIATEIGEVGISWFDFYSIGHICFGIGLFLFFSLFYTIPKRNNNIPIFSLIFVEILTITFAVLWELIENLIFLNLGWKFENRADSLQNITTDILLGAIGGLGTWLFAYITFEKEKKPFAYYTFGIIGFGVWIGIFIILRYLTLHNSPII
ncbi:hypothetical protein LCGC14_2690510 [marine sediment metagenome]|uniref:VanZ-like domain-containing protein n=1 Tax=marine sediment metagenome TaxID=412755 RepID=A0A0F9CAC8_9ZZZZ|nr:hypothetical protein [bacterium]